MRARKFISILLLLGLLLGLSGCTKKSGFVILSGSENTVLAPIIDQFNKDNHTNVQMVYKGSLDIMQDLTGGSPDCDAVWPANSLWINLGDQHHLVKHLQSVYTTPVVFGIRKSVAQKLGFVGKQVSVKDILRAIQAKQLTFMMTSATQSNSGASAYIGFLYALLGNQQVITSEDLNKPELKTQITAILSGINRSSGSSDWLEELFLKGSYDAMVNYEALIIDANKQLIQQGKEPLYVVYPYDGLTIADSPLGYVDKGDPKKEELFNKLQAYLLSDKVQAQLLALGRRTGVGASLSNADSNVFNPDWGIDPKRVLNTLRMPAPEVIQEALSLYQTEYRKPSFTVFCLDFSGSMSGKGEEQVKQAMSLLLDQQQAKQYFLQETSRDVVAVIPFNDQIIDTWQVSGNDAGQLQGLLNNINNTEAGGSTDIYSPAIKAMSIIKQASSPMYSSAVILMTDGASNTGKSLDDLRQAWNNSGLDVPVFSITFGSADDRQLNDIATLTRGRVFDGKTNLVDAFKKAKGYN